MAERLRALRERPIDPTEKGFGPLATAGLGGLPRRAGRHPAGVARGGIHLPAADPARVGAGEQHRGDGGVLRPGRGGAGPARQDRHVARARRPPADPRRLGHHRRHRRPAAYLPHVRLPPAAARQRARGRGGHRLAGRRTRRRSRLRGLLLRRQRRRRGHLGPGAQPSPGAAAGRPQARRPGGDRPRRRAHRLPHRRPRARRGEGGGRHRHPPGGGRGRVRGKHRRRERGGDTRADRLLLPQAAGPGRRPRAGRQAGRRSSSRPAAARTSTW